MITSAFFNKKPLPTNRFSPLPLGAVQPDGWLKTQLDMQADQLEEHIDQFFPGTDGESSWLGGNLQDYTSAVTALSSLVTIAYVTNRVKLQEIVTRFMKWTLKSQDADGNFGPKGCLEWWPRILMLRVLRQYFLASGDKDVLRLMDRFFRYELEALPSRPLTGEACSRGSENILIVLWLYNLTGQKHLLKLCMTISAQSLDWTNEMHIFPHIRDMAKQRPWEVLHETLEAGEPLNGITQKVNEREYHLTQAVDIAFGIKAPGVTNLIKSGFKELNAFNVGWRQYMRYHGVALHMYTGDDNLSGPDPSRGVNLEAAAEVIHSLSALIALSDESNTRLSDLMEQLALNIPLAAWNLNATMRPRLIQVNQLNTARANHNFYNASEDSLVPLTRPMDLFDGALADYTASLWYATYDGGLQAVGYAPCVLNYVIKGKRVHITVSGDYPFGNNISIKVETRESVTFPIYLNIPNWTDQGIITQPDGSMIQLDGGEVACIKPPYWLGENSLELHFEMVPRLSHWSYKSAGVELGPLVMALNLDDPDNASVWNWALDDTKPMELEPARDENPNPKTHCPIPHVKVSSGLVPAWCQEGYDCATLPIQPPGLGFDQTITLVPFAATNLRIAQFPVMRNISRK